ncbi:MAG: sigma factor AlgU regulator MucB [Congregibacter sp.]
MSSKQQTRSRCLQVLARQVLTAACLTVSALAVSQECPDIDADIMQLLDAMAANSQRIEYSGVVTLQRGGDMQIMEISHRVNDGRATEQLARLTGQDALVERAGHPTNCVHPGHQLLKSGHLFNGSFCGLSSAYRFRLVPGERVAGRQAVRLRVEPRDMYRFGYVFELDTETALMLKSSTLASDQRVIEEFQFASLNMRADAMEAAQTQHQTGHPHPHETAHLRSGPAWEPAWLPAGFMPTDTAPHDSPRKTYTDGLASFSVFLEPLANAIKPGEGVERQGSTVAYTRGVALKRRPVLITVLGEVPTNTARMVADSVRLR